MYSSISKPLQASSVSSLSTEQGQQRHVRLSRLKSYVMLCILALIGIFGDVEVLTRNTRRLEEDEASALSSNDDETTTIPSGPPPPIIYTFFSELGAQPMAGGMAEEDHKRLLNHWRREWREAGWDPIVLTMKDARKHPDFMKLKPLLKETGAGPYNILCFVRWLAVAFAGGGWMADYDVFPLHDFRDEGRTLPNDGTLTIHNRLCPSLVSGSAQEWTRVANEMIQYAAAHQISSDQNALAAIFRERDHAVFEQDWSVTQTVFNATGWTPDACDEHTPSSMRAVHFAHTPMKRALKDGRLPASWSMRQRPEVASQFISQWLAQCGDRKPFQRDSRLLLQSRSTEYKQQVIITTHNVVTVDEVPPKVAEPKPNLSASTNAVPPIIPRQVVEKRKATIDKGSKKKINASQERNNRSDLLVFVDSKQKLANTGGRPKYTVTNIEKQENRGLETIVKNSAKSDYAMTLATTTMKNEYETIIATKGKISRARYMQALGIVESLPVVGQATTVSKAVVKIPLVQTAPKKSAKDNATVSSVGVKAKARSRDSRVPTGTKEPTTPVTQKKKAKFNPARGLLG